ncbi:AEC family transporter [Candidatus Trichorickettsia mobilis]|uniref:AEC family transporter n=1 Tax=Candidatus Trichorickettsia mobilis TaxID=1346319 RepID=UPI0029300F1E|nr:AEC family transporter [Candidatus Trichorickettsia mobilis]
MQDILFSTLPIFLITLIGSIIKRKWLVSEEFWRGLEKLSYFLLFPALLFNYISTADLKSVSLFKLILGLVISTSIISIALILHRRHTNGDKIQFTSIFQGSIRYNNYIFFSVSNALFDAFGLTIVAVISSYMIVFTNLLSILVFASFVSNQKNEKHHGLHFVTLSLKLIFTNPLIISSILGFIFNYAEVELNLGVQKTISSLSDSALAIGMLNVGASLKFIAYRKYYRQILYTSLIKLVLLPIVTFVVLWLMSVNDLERSIGILYSCIPCASTAYALSRQLGGDPESMASIITFMTIFSVVSLSILMYILG